MAWFKNKNTGLVWCITDPAHVERLTASADYEEVKPKAEDVQPEAPAPTKKGKKANG